MKISSEYTDSLKDFLECAIREITNTMAEDADALLHDKYYSDSMTKYLTVATKLYNIVIPNVTLVIHDDDVSTLVDIIECFIFSIIRHDEQIDSMEWFANIAAIWRQAQK